jgi:hypothetical protein
MNSAVMKSVDYKVDTYDINICKFDLIPNKRKLLFNQKEQSIHSIDDVDQKLTKTKIGKKKG